MTKNKKIVFCNHHPQFVLCDCASNKPKEDKPEPNKQYRLTGGKDQKAISNGNTWAEGEGKGDFNRRKTYIYVRTVFAKDRAEAIKDVEENIFTENDALCDIIVPLDSELRAKLEALAKNYYEN